MDWDYEKFLALFRERENYGGNPWFKIEPWVASSVLIRITKNVLLIAGPGYFSIVSPVKNSYRVELESIIYYEDIEYIRISHMPLEIDFKLKNVKTHIFISTPIKWNWGYDVRGLPVYCEDRLNEMFGIKSSGVKE